MNILQAAILGLVQGLGEFLPISSSGHLLLSRILMGFTIDETGAYHMLDILLHVGTLIPVLIVFWKDWWAILKNPFKSKTLLLLFIASLPTLLFKVVFGTIEQKTSKQMERFPVCSISLHRSKRKVAYRLQQPKKNRNWLF